MIELRRSTSSLSKSLDTVKTNAINEANTATDTLRRKFITPIAGQDMIYLSKEQEASKYLALEEEPEELTEYPFIAAEIGSTGDTAYQVAYIYAYRATQWRMLGAMIERLRATVMDGIYKAVTEADVALALKEFIEDLGELG